MEPEKTDVYFFENDDETIKQLVSGQGYKAEKLSRIRKVIGNAMRTSINEMPQLTHMAAFDMTEMIQLRAELNVIQEEKNLPRISYNDILLYVVSRVLLRHVCFNAHVVNGEIHIFDHVHLGMAVDTPKGLLVPTIFNADTKTIFEISREAKSLSAAAREGTLSPDYLMGGTFTVSNLGTLGVEYFTPIINPPQTGILGVGCITQRIRNENGKTDVFNAMGLSITFDHRALDGADAARFLQDLNRTLEKIHILFNSIR